MRRVKPSEIALASESWKSRVAGAAHSDHGRLTTQSFTDVIMDYLYGDFGNLEKGSKVFVALRSQANVQLMTSSECHRGRQRPSSRSLEPLQRLVN